MGNSPLLITKLEHVCILTLNRPEKRNALTSTLLENLIDVLLDRSVRVFILRGIGGRFSAGYDLEELQTHGIDAVQAMLGKATDAIETCHCPVITLLEGHCIGAAMELASASDIRLAVEGTRLGIPSNRLGLLYAPGGLGRLHVALGDLWARYLLLTGDTVDARVLQGTFLHRVVPPDNAIEQVKTIAQTISRQCGPLSLTATKSALKVIRERPPLTQESADLLHLLNRQCAESKDARECLQAFSEKRAPVFTGE